MIALGDARKTPTGVGCICSASQSCLLSNGGLLSGLLRMARNPHPHRKTTLSQNLMYAWQEQDIQKTNRRFVVVLQLIIMIMNIWYFLAPDKNLRLVWQLFLWWHAGHLIRWTLLGRRRNIGVTSRIPELDSHKTPHRRADYPSKWLSRVGRPRVYGVYLIAWWKDQKCSSKGIWRQGIVLNNRIPIQKSLCPVVICPYFCSSETTDCVPYQTWSRRCSLERVPEGWAKASLRKMRSVSLPLLGTIQRDPTPSNHT